MEKKTIEEKKVAIFAECVRVCPNYGDTYQLSGGIYLQALSHGWALYETRKDSEYSKCFEPIWNYLDPSDTTVQIFYALLGLAERDAISELREESDKYFTELEAERERSAALVADLKECLETDYCDFHEASSLIEEAKDILEANEKGGAND